MSPRPYGFKESGWLGLQHKLTKTQKAGEGAWTVPSRRAVRLKLLELAVAAGVACDLFGGRLTQTATHEHNPTGGDDE